MTMRRKEKASAKLDLAQEARRQSLLVSRTRSERETIEFIWELANTDDALRGWRVD
jgi:hypothetical protein